jgi:hypothetical protein
MAHRNFDAFTRRVQGFSVFGSKRRPPRSFVGAVLGAAFAASLMAALVPRVRRAVMRLLGRGYEADELSLDTRFTEATQANEGEGSRTAARRYDEAATAFAHSGKVKQAAAAARRAVEGPEAADLKEAERQGKLHGA